MHVHENCVFGFSVSIFVTLLSMVISSAAAAETQTPADATMRVYIGTYTGRNSQGIYQCDLDLRTGKLSQPELAGEAVNPSFLALRPTESFCTRLANRAAAEAAARRKAPSMHLRLIPAQGS